MPVKKKAIKKPKKKTVTKQPSVADIAKIEEKELSLTVGTTDPRRKLFASLYMDPNSKTFGNMKRSAMAAGFKEEYANVLSYQNPKWLSEILSQNNILEIAMANLHEDISLSLYTKVIPRTKSDEMIEVFDKDKAKHRREMTTVALKALHSKFKGKEQEEDESKIPGAFKGATFKTVNINYNLPQPPPQVIRVNEEDDSSFVEGEVIDVQSKDIDLEDLLNA